MGNPFSILSKIAENKIQEAMSNREFDNLPGAGKPLKLEDESHIPEHIRMAHKILKNSGHIPEEISWRKDTANILELLDETSDEREKIKNIQKARLLLERIKAGKSAALESRDEYYQKMLARLEKHERGLSRASPAKKG